MLGFGAGYLFAVPKTDATGAAIANGTPVQFGTLQEVSLDVSFEEKVLYGNRQFPVAVGRGKGSITMKAKAASFNGRMLGDLVFGTGSSAGIRGVVANFAAAVPGSPAYTVAVAPPSSGTFSADLGVVNASTGRPLTKVASAPSTGEYSVSAGTYTFASADANLAVLISYEYTANSTTARKGTITGQLMGFTPTIGVYLYNSYQAKDLALTLNRVAANKFSFPFKNEDFVVPDIDLTAYEDDAGTIGYWSTSE